MMGLTRKAEYAIRGMLFLAQQPRDTVVMLDTIVDAVESPKPFLAKILQSLVSEGLVRSVKGAGGGFALAAPPEKISLCRIVEAIEGPVMPNRCLMEDDACPRRKTCTVHPVWRRIQSLSRGILEEATLGTLTAKGSGKGGAGAGKGCGKGTIKSKIKSKTRRR